MKVFLSYARKDGAALAGRLEEELRSHGHEPWRDLSQLEGGASWTDALEAAIDACDALVAVLTPGSFRSGICRGEQIRALRKGKRVIPALARADADCPLQLEHLHRCDLAGSYEDGVRELLRALGAGAAAIPEKARRTSLNAPPRPPHVIERPEDVKRVRDALLSEEPRRAVGLTALRGMGGIGKTVLANLVARDPVLLDAFPDGVLWFEVGKSPASLASQLAVVGREVEGPEFRLEHYASVEAATHRLRRILPDKAALVVLDDVWEAAHLEPFLFEAPRCRTLFTTREGRIASKLGAGEVLLGTLTAAQSRELLRSWAGRDDPALEEIATALGHLPLALRIAGARLREGLTGRQWLERFAGRVSQIRLDRRATARDESLDACFLLSLDAFTESEARLFDALGVFPEDLPVPVAQVTRLWSALEPAVSAADCAEILHDLDRASLVQIGPQETVVLHDLLHELARERLGDARRGLNERFLAAHNPRGRPWHEVPDDGYLHRHLAWHLVEAGRSDELRRLLGSYAWLAARTARGGASELLSDYDLLGPGHELTVVRDALRLSAHVLAGHPEQLPCQLLGRLLDADGDCARALCREASAGRKRPWLRPLRASLVRPGGALLRTLMGHTDGVTAVAVTPDGRHAISASDDHTLKVWDLQSGAALRTLTGHANVVTATTVTPDGRHAVSASWDNTLRVWDVESGAELRTLGGHTSWVMGVAVTPDGKRAVSASWDQTLKVWDLQSGAELFTLAGHTGNVDAVAVTPDGRRAVSASWDQTLKVWDLQSGTELFTLAGHTGNVDAVAVTPDGRRAISGSWDERLKVWDLESGAELRTLTGHTDPVTAVAVTPDGRHAVSASWDQMLKVWDLESGAELRTLTGHASVVAAVAVAPDGRHAASASWDKTLKVWDLESGTEVRTLTGHTRWVMAMTVTPDGRHAVSASDDQTLKLWDLESGSELRTLTGHQGVVNAVAVAPGGRRAVSASMDCTLKVWDLESGSELRTLTGHTRPVSAVAVTPDGRNVVSASGDETLKVWDLDTGAELRTLTGHLEPVMAVRVTPDGKHAVSAAWDENLKIWDVRNGVELHTMAGHTHPVTAVAVTPDGRHALSASRDHTLKVWDLENGAALRTLSGHDHAVMALAVTPDGRHAVSASLDHTLKVWDIEIGAELRTLRGHTDAVTALAVTPDGRHAVSASDDATLKVWDLDTAEELSSFVADAPMQCVAFASGVVVAGDSLGGVHLLRLEDAASAASA